MLRAATVSLAVKWQTKAIELETDAKENGEYRAPLKVYQEKKPIPG